MNEKEANECITNKTKNEKLNELWQSKSKPKIIEAVKNVWGRKIVKGKCYNE